MGTEAVGLAAALCRRFEGFVSAPYLCPAGVPTQGYGTVWRPDGRKVRMDDPPIDRDTAEEWLQYTLLTDYMPGVLRASPVLLYYPARLAAMTDFAYNLGVGRYRASTLRRRVNEEDWDGAGGELGKWVYSRGRVLRGLVLRRLAERELLDG